MCGVITNDVSDYINLLDSSDPKYSRPKVWSY